MFQSLKDKPDSVKKKIALITAGFFSLIILIVWIWYILPTTQETVAETGEKGFALWSKLEENVSTVYSTVGNEFNQITNRFKEIKMFKEGVAAGAANSQVSTTTTYN